MTHEVEPACQAPELEVVGCGLCGSNDGAESDTVDWRGVELRYAICRSCGLKYMSRRPTQGWYADYYAKEFWVEKSTFSDWSRKGSRESVALDDGTRRRIEKQRWRAQRILDLTEPVVRLGPDSTLLDVGTAFGATPALFGERYGCRLLGVEPSAHARSWCEEAGIEMVGRTMEDLQGPQPFDGKVTLVVMSHVLENIVEPWEALANVRRLLASDGFLYIDTCNLYYNNATNPYHPYVFSPETLCDLLGRSGFRLVAQYCETHPRQAVLPTDPYLAVVAQPAEPTALRRRVDVEQLVVDQQLGLELYEKASDLARKARKRRARGETVPTG